MTASKQPGLAPPKTAEQILNIYYLEARFHLLETAAILDRIQRAEGGDNALEDPRIQTLLKTCNILTQGRTNRAEQFLNLLSLSE